ncbi:MAG: amino acid permease [Nanoarchaeota archaeon]|nr:amino acid permease [Nanoarchaeota archaeon]
MFIISKNSFGAIATLIGCIIGAGILGIPYVVAKAGFITGLIDIVLIGIVMIVMHLYLGEVVLRTKGNHQLVGYAEKYLGKTGKNLMWFAMVFVIYGALVAYTIKEGDFFNALFNSYFGGNPFTYSLIFLGLMAFLVYFELNVLEKSEILMVSILLGVIFLICIFALPHINTNNLTSFNPSSFFLPYGVILFAFLGTVAVPEMKEELKENRAYLKKAIIIGSLIPLIIYIIFAAVVVGVTGINTTDGAILGLGNAIGYEMLVFGTLFGIITMMSSFLILAFSLKKMFEYDYKIDKFSSWFLTCSVPLVIFLLGMKSFVRTIGVAGSVSGGLMGILIVIMYIKAKKLGNRKPEYSIKKSNIIIWVLILLFIFGIFYELLNVFGLISI